MVLKKAAKVLAFLNILLGIYVKNIIIHANYADGIK